MNEGRGDRFFGHSDKSAYRVILHNISRSTLPLQTKELISAVIEALATITGGTLHNSKSTSAHLRASLTASSIPPHILSLSLHLRQELSMAQPPTPIIPLLTPRT